MGDRAASGGRIHRRQGRARSDAHGFRRRRREAVDLFVSGRGAEAVRADAAAFRARLSRRRARFCRPRVQALVPLRRERAGGRRRSVQGAGHGGERDRRCGRLSAAYRAAGCAAERGRNLGAGEARRAQGDRRLGCAVRHRERDEPAGEARAAHRARGAPPGRERRAGRHRPPRCALWRCAYSRAPARAAVRGDHPRAQERTCRSRRRRPPGAHRAYRGNGPDRACRRAAVAGRRSGACGRPAQPAIRLLRRGLV